MKLKAFKSIVDVLRLIVLTGFLVGCTHVYKMPVYSVTTYPEQEKLDLKVALQVSEDLRNAKWQRGAMGDTWIILLGEHLVHNSERVARTLFTEVVVTQDTNDPLRDRIDAILIPRMIFVEQSMARTAWGDAVLSVALDILFVKRDNDHSNLFPRGLRAPETRVPQAGYAV